MRHVGFGEQWVTGGAFSPDGARIVTSSTDNTAILWDTETAARIGKLMLHNGAVNAAVFSGDGERILTASEDKTARVWDATTGAPIGQALGQADEVKSALFSPDGARIVTVSGKTVRVWTVAPVARNIIATACKMLRDHDISGLAERYGVEIKAPICTPDAPAPDPSLMMEH